MSCSSHGRQTAANTHAAQVVVCLLYIMNLLKETVW